MRVDVFCWCLAFPGRAMTDHDGRCCLPDVGAAGLRDDLPPLGHFIIGERDY